MPSVYCNDKNRREWVLGHDDFCIENFDKCRYAIKIGKQHYCGYCPPRISLSEIIHTEAGCLYCKNVTKKLDSTVCAECLSMPTRVNFQEEPFNPKPKITTT